MLLFLGEKRRKLHFKIYYVVFIDIRISVSYVNALFHFVFLGFEAEKNY